MKKFNDYLINEQKVVQDKINEEIQAQLPADDLASEIIILYHDKGRELKGNDVLDILTKYSVQYKQYGH